jgi:hypothetical protein
MNKIDKMNQTSKYSQESLLSDIIDDSKFNYEQKNKAKTLLEENFLSTLEDWSNLSKEMKSKYGDGIIILLDNSLKDITNYKYNEVEEEKNFNVNFNNEKKSLIKKEICYICLKNSHIMYNCQNCKKLICHQHSVQITRNMYGIKTHESGAFNTVGHECSNCAADIDCCLIL